MALNFAWEIAQLPLYGIYSSGTPSEIAFAIVHCTAGDLLIATACFGTGLLATHRADWPLSRPVLGGIVATLSGLAYTAASEWWNVYEVGSWSYASAMPMLFGIGVSPLLQWVAVPSLGTMLVRNRALFGSE